MKRGILLACCLMASIFAGGARAADPYASNNGLYPPDYYNPPASEGPYKFRKLSHDYPQTVPAHSWLDVRPKGPITIENAPRYVAALKAYAEPTLRKMIEAPNAWDPAAAGWYDMPWMAGLGGDPTDYTGGRDTILGSLSGQIILKASETGGLALTTQNHTIIYYDPVAAVTIGEVFNGPGAPNIPAAHFRDGALVVKAGGVAATPAQWPETDGAAVWRVYRPPISELYAHRNGDSTAPYSMVVTDLRVMQFDLVVKDTEASPETGWVFTTFVYDKNAPKGQGPWDQMVPLGATWGNDPQFNRDPNGLPAGKTLTQFWHSPQAPKYADTTLGWGGRMSGPIDIAERHGVIVVDQIPAGFLTPKTVDADCEKIDHSEPAGKFHASGCFSCHGASQSVLGPRLYPSPILIFHPPSDGTPLCLYTPGSETWAQWYMNRHGNEAMDPDAGKSALKVLAAMPMAAAATASIAGFARVRPGVAPSVAEVRKALDDKVIGLDYDPFLMFAIGNVQLSNKGFSLLPARIVAH